MLKAALERNKQFLNEVIDLQEDFLEPAPSTEIGKPFAPKEKKLKFQVSIHFQIFFSFFKII